MNLEIETVVIERKSPLLQFYVWRCIPCKGYFTEWIEKDNKDSSECPECGKIHAKVVKR